MCLLNYSLRPSPEGEGRRFLLPGKDGKKRAEPDHINPGVKVFDTALVPGSVKNFYERATAGSCAATITLLQGGKTDEAINLHGAGDADENSSGPYDMYGGAARIFADNNNPLYQ
jgi:hypothetical protein